jgi:hypothetical protein
MDMTVAKVAAVNGAVALLLFAGAAIAQDQAEPPARPAAPPKITYVDGQLRIDALGSTLAAVLTQVAALTGAKIDVPAGASSERMPVVELGPGPARQILASLLSDSNFDYLIQASDADPEKIQSVLLLPREKKGSGTEVAARAARGPNVAAVAPPEAPPAEIPVAPQPETIAPEANPSNPAPAAMQADPSAPAANQSGQYPLLQPDTTNPAKPGALTPPSSLSPDTISQQLQQMYQQRAQMTQQDHYTGTQPLPAIPGVK